MVKKYSKFRGLLNRPLLESTQIPVQDLYEKADSSLNDEHQECSLFDTLSPSFQKDIVDELRLMGVVRRLTDDEVVTTDTGQDSLSGQRHISPFFNVEAATNFPSQENSSTGLFSDSVQGSSVKECSIQRDPNVLKSLVVSKQIDGSSLVQRLFNTKEGRSVLSGRRESKSPINKDVWGEMFSDLERKGIRFESRDSNQSDGHTNATLTYYGTSATFYNHQETTKIRMRIRFYLSYRKDSQGKIDNIRRAPATAKTGFLEIKIKNPRAGEDNFVDKYRLVLPDHLLARLVNLDPKSGCFSREIDEIQKEVLGLEIETQRPEMIRQVFETIRDMSIKKPRFLKPSMAVSYERKGYAFDESYPLSEKEPDVVQFQMTVDKNVKAHYPLLPGKDAVVMPVLEHFDPAKQTEFASYPQDIRVIEFKEPKPMDRLPYSQKSKNHRFMTDIILDRLKKHIAWGKFDKQIGKYGTFRARVIQEHRADRMHKNTSIAVAPDFVQKRGKPPWGDPDGDDPSENIDIETSFRGREFERGVDQGERGPLHVNVTAPFIAESFQENGRFSLAKSELFLKELREQRKKIAHHARETAILEGMTRHGFHDKKAIKKGDAKGTFAGAGVVQGFDKYLIPQIEALIQKIKMKRPEKEILGVAEDFVRGYGPYFAPNVIRTALNYDSQFMGILKHTFLSRHPQRKKEATNLVVDSLNHEEIKQHLGPDVPYGHYLSPSEIETLRKGGMDFSKLHPGVSSFWHRATPEEVRAKKSQFSSLFPSNQEKLTYEAPRYRSKDSTKMTASFERDGVRHKVKIKIGTEVHGDLLCSKIFEHLGLFQDQMKHYNEIKMCLGDKTFSQFERELGVKYGVKDVRRCIQRRGTDPETGEHWVVFKDSLIELRPEGEIRATVVDKNVYDGANTRERQSLALLFAFLGVDDGKPENYRSVYVPNEQGEYRVEHRFHDLGSSLGATTLLRRPKDLLTFPSTKFTLDAYERSFLKKKRNGDVSIQYNDYMFSHDRDFGHVSHADNRWLARGICSLPQEIFLECIKESGIPDDLVEYNLHKLVKMRNQIVSAFDLAGEKDWWGRNVIHLFPVKKPTELNVASCYETKEGAFCLNRTVKNGELQGTYYEGKIVYPKLQNTWMAALESQLSSQLGQSAKQQVYGQIGKKVKKAIKENDGPLATALDPENFSLPIPIELGITVTPSRTVLKNDQLFSSEGEGHPFVVRDTLTFSIGVNSPAFTKALSLLISAGVVEAGAKIQCIRNTVQHIHFAESWASGRIRQFMNRPIFSLLKNDNDMEDFAVDQLGTGEVLHSNWAYGIDTAASVAAKVPFLNVSPVSASANASLAWVNADRTSYTKDVYGALHLLKEVSKERRGQIGLKGLNVDTAILQGSLLGGHLGVSHEGVKYWDIEVKPKEYDQKHPRQALADVDKADLKTQLRILRHQPEMIEGKHPFLKNIQSRFRIDAKRKSSTRGLQALFLLNANRANSKSGFRVKTDEHEYDFFVKRRAKKQFAGWENTPYEFGNKNYFVKDGTSKRMILEMDRANPRHFVTHIDVFDYHRKIRYPQLTKFIKRLNQRYSKDAKTPFFDETFPIGRGLFRKVYANTRITLNGEKLLQCIEENERLSQTLSELYEPELMEKEYQFKKRTHLNILEKIDRKRIQRQLLRRGERLRNAVQECTRHAALEEVSEKRLQEAQDNLADEAFEFVYLLYKSKYGVGLLKKLLGEEGMKVHGEIFGIHRNTGHLQDNMWKNTLRYCGESWGAMQKISPVSHYICYEQPMEANAHAAPKIPFDHYLGDVASLEPGNFISLGER